MEESSAYLCECRYVKYLIFRIGDALNKDRLGLLVDRGGKGFRSRIRNPLDANTKVLKSYCNEVVSDRMAGIKKL